LIWGDDSHEKTNLHYHSWDMPIGVGVYHKV